MALTVRCGMSHAGEPTESTMSDLRAFFGPNAGYVLELYDRYLDDPSAVDEATRRYFASFSPPTTSDANDVPAAAVSAPVSTSAVDVQKIAGAVNLAYGIREYGHLAVPLDPLGSARPGAPEVSPETYGI